MSQIQLPADSGGASTTAFGSSLSNVQALISARCSRSDDCRSNPHERSAVEVFPLSAGTFASNYLNESSAHEHHVLYASGVLGQGCWPVPSLFSEMASDGDGLANLPREDLVRKLQQAEQLVSMLCCIEDL